MSELLKVAAALRSMSDEKLQRLIIERMIPSGQLVDFFDLAEALTKPTSVSAAISGLPLGQAKELRGLCAGVKPNPKIASHLADQMLTSPSPEFAVFPSTLEAFAEFSKKSAVSLSTLTITTLEEIASPPQNDIDRDAGVEVFETMQAITELIFDLEHRFVREVGRKNVGLPDLRRLASHLKKSTDFAKQIYELANLANLITLQGQRWQLSSDSESWLSWTPVQRYKHLVKTWREILGDSSASELSDSVKSLPGIVSLEQQLKLNYPFADSSVSSKISRLAQQAELIGISSAGWLCSWGNLVLNQKFDAASKEAVSFLPAPARKLICQADLTLIAPGPLPTEDEIFIRRFADTEQIGLASTYRLSALSISHGLETGLKVPEIRRLLVDLAEKDLPQPIEYLLNESEARFGRLQVFAEGVDERSIIKSEDRVLIAEILNEIKLKPFALVQLEEGQLASRFEPEVIYFALRELGFVAVRVDSKGKVISPMSVAQPKSSLEQQSSVINDIKRLRAQDEVLGSSPNDDDLQRQIQLAIKNKTTATFTVLSSDKEIDFLLEPIGLANGRLRAKDKKADIERTLPLSSIIRVTLG